MSEVFLSILNMSISASWLVLAVLVIRSVLKRAPKWVNVLLWGMVAVRLICPFTVESSVSLIPDSVGSGEFVSEWADDYIGDIDIHHSGSEHYDAAVGAGREPIFDGAGSYYVVTKHDQLGEPATIENTVVPVLAILWASGIAFLALYTVVSCWRLHRKVSEAVILRENIYQSENVASPFVLGIVRPKIYLPSRMDEGELEHVIAHERAHIRRRDHWWKPLGFLLLAVHWFNPLMWAAYGLLCRDIELACDEKVIREMGNEQRADYMQALVACSVNRRMIAACPLAFGEVGVKERVKSVLNYRKPAFWVIVVSVFLCAAVAVCFLTNPVGFRFDEASHTIVFASYFDMRNSGEAVTGKLNPAQIEELGSRLAGVRNTKKRDEYGGFTPGYQISALLEDGTYIRISGYSLSEQDRVDIQWNGERYVVSDREFQEYLSRICAAGDVSAADSAYHGRTYTYEQEGIVGDFTITLYNDGTFSYYEGLASSYLGFGTWTQVDDIVTMTDDVHGGMGLVNHFKRDGNDLVFVAEGSSRFLYVDVRDGERFCFSGVTLKAEDALMPPEGAQSLSVDDVVALSRKGYDLTWSDFGSYPYITTGSGLYIRCYEIDGVFRLWIGGVGPDDAPMYIYLALADDLDTRIDIRDGGVEEFVAKDHSETLLNRAIYDAILAHNRSEKTVGLNNCASFVRLGEEDLSGTPAVGSADHVGIVTVYGLALYLGYDMVNGQLQEVVGSHIPTAITFEVRNGRYTLKEYWIPRDGAYYAPDVRAKFPDKIGEEALDTRKYIAAQKQECLMQAMAHNGDVPTEPLAQPLSAEEIDFFNRMLYPILYDEQGSPMGVSPWSCFFTSYYDDVRDLDFVEFMRYFPGSRSYTSDAEVKALSGVAAWPFGGVEKLEDMPVPISKYPAELVDLALTECAGITTAELDTSGVAYLPQYDAYYNYTSDFGPGMFTCTRGEVNGDIVRLYEEQESGTDLLVLRKAGSQYQIVAHQQFEGDNGLGRYSG